MFAYNPCFKRPERDGRAVSSPRAFVEPLSPPSRPRPIEPHFNYPAIHSRVTFSARPEQQSQLVASSKNAHCATRRHGHHRASSSIDALAEAALAASPPYHSYSKSSSHNDQLHASYSPQNGASEPPHKRARSDLLPSPALGVYASRPATSYDYSHGWSNNGIHQPGYESRVEEAALLLNFRTGGPRPFLQPAPPSASRPHANSFPQAARQPRPKESSVESGLLPPFSPTHVAEQLPVIPFHHGDFGLDSKARQQVTGDDVTMTDAREQIGPTFPGPPLQQRLALYDGTDTRSSELSEQSQPQKSKRGWPKGKPRGPSSKKTAASKATTKRVATRKKTDAGSKRVDSASHESESCTNATKSEMPLERRKSLNDLHAAYTAIYQRPNSVPPDVLMQIRDVPIAKPTRRNLKAAVDMICANCAVTRQTATSHGEMDEWISCNGCSKWFHIDCAGFKKAHEVKDVDKFFCTPCEPSHGRTTFVRKSTRAHASVDYAELQKGVLKTSEESQEHHYIQPIKDGTFTFDEKDFRLVRPEMVTRDIFERSELFTEPICIPAEFNPRPWEKRKTTKTENMEETLDSSEGATMDELMPEEFEYDPVPDDGQDKLDMVMPENLTVRHVCNLVGGDYPLDVIDVKTQNSGGKWNLGRWADYYEDEGEDKSIRNVISLEVSKSKLGRLLRRPKVVRDIDLQDSVWPQEEKDKGKWPNVQFYCLMSVADSYTDFHIDFGGSSVYYHILKGKKTFFFIPPKPKHLKAYEEWNESPEQNFTFLPHITKECYRVDLKEGDTMLIPSGWIHAVWTPETSLVIGGNFLTRMSFQNQFKVAEVEQNNHTPMKFRYPFFQRIMWYTVLQYLSEDPLPQEVSRLLHNGKRFERQVPIWQDFDGDAAAHDTRPGASNARYYSKAELDGLPDLAAYIFRTVMVVMGRVEGVTQDRMRRVNTGIPKGHGEPLEIARRFAEWVAWKRSEDPPAWAHPDAVLPKNEEGAQKKLSARTLKEMERKEAIAAYRLVPDRQSGRLMEKEPTNQHMPSTPPPSRKDAPEPQPRSSDHQSHQLTPAPPSNTTPEPVAMISTMNAPYVSTPKTSVLGPKRVACDACRRRRIRCKHKDMVTEVPFGMPVDPSIQPHLSPDMLDSIAMQSRNYFNCEAGESPNGHPSNGTLVFATEEHHTPQPGTNAYINANIPMAMNGVAMFGDVSKRGRSKACYDCRKSKRRCVHDDQGNVDPVKAAENPVPRGTVPSRKRQSTEDGSPSQIVEKPKIAHDSPSAHLGQLHGPAQSVSQPFRVNVVGPTEEGPCSHDPSSNPYYDQEQPPLDPDLFALSGDDHGQHFGDDTYHPYPTTEQAAPQFQFQSLEQIANEVLDMNGRSHEHHAALVQHNLECQPHVHNIQDASPQPDGINRPDGSVDSAVSLPGADPKSSDHGAINGTAHSHHVEHSVMFQGLPLVQQSELEVTSGASNGLPLYQPPAPVQSQSPELSKRPLASGLDHPPSPSLDQTSHKRKRDSLSSATSSKFKVAETDDERLARLLRQEDLGLRVRP